MVSVNISANVIRLGIFQVAVCVLLGFPCTVAWADEVSSNLYLRADTDHTTVISPRVRASKRIGDATAIDATYAADIWTSASIDIRTSASVRPVTEQRDEINVDVTHQWNDLHLHGGYRFSTEPDYRSHGLSLGAGYDLANNASTLDANVHVFIDNVGRSGNPEFSRGVGTVDASFAFTQVLDPNTLAKLTYEIAHVEGYQASPYRFVGVGLGATGYGCVAADRCLPERVPDARTRHAFALLFRRAVSSDFSFGVTYRYYIDDWVLGSHTVLADLGWNVAEHTLLQLRYRYYRQSRVGFYQARYAVPTIGGYVTRDRELSGLTYHRIGAEFQRDFPLGAQGAKLAATLAVSGNFYRYDDFVGLDQVRALEVTAALLLEI